ncbi:MAG: molybdopterin-dependent oxidoreductase [Pseudomonadales bacterium]
MSNNNKLVPTSTHWGNYLVETDGEQLIAVHSYAVDNEPSPIAQSLLDAHDDGVRIPQPMVREGYLNKTSDGSGRGKERFIPVSWETALDLAADALRSTMDQFGPDSIYGCSGGWASAGRFHHAQSQVHRFLNGLGGFVTGVNTYSSGAAEVITDHILGIPFLKLVREAPTTKEIAEHSKLMVFFGGASIKNTQVNAGGIGRHSAREQLGELKKAGLRIVNISPIRDDLIEELDAEWLACRPGSDVAIMLALAHTIYTESLHDQSYVDKYTVGFEKFIPYLTGASDGVVKDAQWASELSGLPATVISKLGLQLGHEKSTLGISWSVQRQQFGEQTYWMITTLAAMLGHLGSIGGGVGYGYGCIHNMGFGGRRIPQYKMAALGQEQGEAAYSEHKSFIPIARLSDMLLNPGTEYQFNGQTRTYPDIKLIYWAGGNPYHHHQDLNRLDKAWAKPDTVIIHEAFWTATARRADIVFPAAVMLERNDLGGSSYDNFITPMRQSVPPYGKSQTDYETLTSLAERLGFEDSFTAGRTELEWVEFIYTRTRENAAKSNVNLPEFKEFWAGEQFYVGDQLEDNVFTLERFRNDPIANPLRTPSGKIEIFSEKINSFNYDDCIGHPAWYDRSEWLGSELAQKYPLHMISNQPRTQLHSQYDHGRTSLKRKIKGRERARLNAKEAAARGIVDGDIIRLYNDRGACLAGVEISEDIRDQIIELPTGAWFDSQVIADADLEVHGNPNALTLDRGTSTLTQTCSAHSCLVEVEKFTSELPAIKVFSQPEVGSTN